MRRGFWLAVAAIGMLAGCYEPEPDVRTRYVDYYDDTTHPLCGGNAEHIDRYIEGLFELLGEPPPPGTFIDYHWTGRIDEAQTSRANGRSIVWTGFALHERHLVEAVALEAWGDGPRALTFGLGMVLGEDDWLYGVRGKSGEDLERALTPGESFEYWQSWLLVSQMLVEHGPEGLRALWTAVPPDASGAELGAAYEELFGRPIDTLTTPFEVPHEEGAFSVERDTCYFRMCLGDPLSLPPGEVVEGVIPQDCSDPSVLGPSVGSGWFDATWVEFEVDGLPPTGASPEERAIVTHERCGVLECEWRSNTAEPDPPRPPLEGAWAQQPRQRIRIFRRAEVEGDASYVLRPSP